MKKLNRTFFSHLFIGTMMVILLFPLVITFTNSFMDGSDITMNYTSSRSLFDVFAGIDRHFIKMNIIPRIVTIRQYIQTLIYQPAFSILMINSIKLVVPIVLGNLIVSMLAAYGFTIWKWKYKEFVYYVYIVVMLMPTQAILVPNFLMAKFLHIETNYLAIILPGIFSPFGTFILRQSMKVMPIDYLDAASIDGANKFKTLIYVVIPQMKSSMVALSMLVFIENWNLVEPVIIFIKEYYKQPLSVYLAQIVESRIDIAFAASCIYMLIPIWFLLMAQSDLEKGIELSGIK